MIECQLVIDAILHIIPDAKLCVWDLNTGIYHGEQNPVIYKNYAIDWSELNVLPCPSEAEIDDAIEIVKNIVTPTDPNNRYS